MKTYEQPVVVMSDDMSESIFAASGSIATATCWSVSVQSVQDWNGASHVYEMHLVHSSAVSHFSESCTVQYTFGAPVVSAYAEGSGNYEVSVSGNIVTVRRIHHANGEYSGDTVTYKVFVNAADQASTIALGAPSPVILNCEKTGTPNYPNID
ncbi:MAG: hypothetical protein K6G04_01260 [Lachnospiraceae bacterium]|nr:hypothetical protein [Lachnospiraceae bacterium]